MQQETNQNFSIDFQDQLCQKVVSRLEKRYLTASQLTDAELKAFNSAEQSKNRAFYENVMTGSILTTFGFIVSRVPLTGAQTPEQLLAMGYQKRLQMLAVGRMLKLSAYAGLALVFYSRNQSVGARCSSEQFKACVSDPCKDICSESKSFYNQAQIDSMYRAYILKTNKINKANVNLKKYKFDPQSYH